MDIRLIYPSGRRFDTGAPLKKQAKAHRYPGMGLTMVAALTPPGAAIAIVDDEREPIDYDRPADLVGISILTPNARRGYQIAREYRKRGVPVVLGGIHATACPEEAAGEADAVVIGEAEDTWPRLVKDFEAGRLQKIYRSTNDASARPGCPCRGGTCCARTSTSRSTPSRRRAAAPSTASSAPWPRSWGTGRAAARSRRSSKRSGVSTARPSSSTTTTSPRRTTTSRSCSSASSRSGSCGSGTPRGTSRGTRR